MKLMNRLEWAVFVAFAILFALFFAASGMKLYAGSAGLDGLRNASNYGYVERNPFYGLSSVYRRGYMHSSGGWIYAGPTNTCPVCHVSMRPSSTSRPGYYDTQPCRPTC